MFQVFRFFSSYIDFKRNLFIACLNGRKDVLELLIAHNADVNPNTNTWAPLMAGKVCALLKRCSFIKYV